MRIRQISYKILTVYTYSLYNGKTLHTFYKLGKALYLLQKLEREGVIQSTRLLDDELISVDPGGHGLKFAVSLQDSYSNTEVPEEVSVETS